VIIWGSRAVTSTLTEGTFFCPHCRSQQTYRKQRVRRFFTLYFIPLFPMATLGEYVECGVCKNTYKDAVLDYDPEAERRRFQQRYAAMVRSLVAGMAARAGNTSPDGQALVRTLYKELVHADLVEPMTDTVPLDRLISDELPALAGVLSDQGKESLVKAAHRAALLNGAMSAETSAAMAGVARALGITDAHLRGIMAETA